MVQPRAEMMFEGLRGGPGAGLVERQVLLFPALRRE
jgi:hypothetical protein